MYDQSIGKNWTRITIRLKIQIGSLNRNLNTYGRFISNMKLLEYIPDLDCRRYKKDWGSATKNERDWNDYLDQHQIEYKYQNIIRISYLSHYFPVRAYDLAHALNRDYLLSFDVVNSIIKELVNNNKFIHVDKRESDGDIRKYYLFLFPKLPINIQVPHSLLPIKYYEDMERMKGEQDKANK